jgi:hypothetical protein
MKQVNLSIEDPESTERILNVFVVLMAVVLFARGVTVHAGFALFMAVVVPGLLRLFVGLLLSERRSEVLLEQPEKW